jgi:nucleoside-diphosphate-sugar epimerase
MATPRILIIGANGQIGTELGDRRWPQRLGAEAVVTSDLAPDWTAAALGSRHEALDVTEVGRADRQVVERHGITQVYLLAAALSAQRRASIRKWAWDLNMGGLAERAGAGPHAAGWSGCSGRARSRRSGRPRPATRRRRRR